jgi:imidazole glycerol-phosphate synthase subunit HisH
MLTVIDYGAGNLRSVLHALNHLGVVNVRLVHEPADLKDARQIILPGVGAFGAGMQQLHKQGLVEPLKDALQAGIPYLGICLGMQFLFERSDEMGNHEGLGVLPGVVTRFPDSLGLKIPHMGWNQLEMTRPNPLMAEIDNDSYAYFVHSYYCIPTETEDLLIKTHYGIDFAAGVQRDNIYGVQFHPEKSQMTGLKLLSNFLKITEIVR